MPIRLPADFPSAEKLNQEGVFTHTYERAFSQEIRPLKIALLNLMPTKIDTEVQLLRLLSLSSIQIEPLFLKTSSHQTKYGAEHLDKFYVDFPSISNQRFDAIIITGAPLEQLDFEQVDYWDELVEVVHWANDNVFAELFICWGAQAGLYIDFGIQKTMLEQKLFGVFDYTTSGQHRLTRGFDDVIRIPQSRFSELNHSDLAKVIASGKLIPLLTDTHGTPNIITTPHTHKTYLLGHLEYDRETLDIEYRRDLAHAKNSQYSV
ncbi:MAG: homoserine O-succinyltransferase, partial [Bifidobacteriaceae bacterium]|nr:homoserine O-succinyltransferase [Bifidobacteriaceae bacterium]